MLRANNDPCLHCNLPECPGICDKVRGSMSEVDTTKAVHTITWCGMKRSVSEWAEILGVSRSQLYKRLETAESDVSVLREFIVVSTDDPEIPASTIEEVYIRLTTLHTDYRLYWNRLHGSDSSAGLVARYGAVRASPTNATSNPVEQRAMPELNMTDEALNRRAWVACVLDVITYYQKRNRSKPRPGDRIRARLLELRAIEGLTIKKICARMNETDPYRCVEYNPMHIRRYMEAIVRDIAREAIRRGLIEPQK